VLEGLRLLLWRFRRTLAVLWITANLAAVGLLVAYYFWLPAEADVGVAILARTLAYRHTFREVDRATAELAEGKTEPAASRLRLFLREHDRVQSGHIDAHAVTDASLALAEAHVRSERLNDAISVITRSTRIEPLDYRLWYKLGQLYGRGGDEGQGARSFRRAFLLAPNHPDLTSDYLALLGPVAALDEAQWVADQFERASRRGLPSALVKVGPPRSALQRRLLDWAGVPVEHGDYRAAYPAFNLARGAHREVLLPPALLAASPADEPLYIWLNFSDVYHGLQIEALRYRTVSGEEREAVLAAGQVSYLHRPDSAKDYYAEVRSDLRPGQLSALSVVYSCPEHTLTAEAGRVIARARLTAQAWRPQ
jgi:tetratricopeptide (TPR) repeat protein